MAINFAEKYSSKVDEHFVRSSITHAAFNHDYDWDGVATVNVYSVATAPLNDYQMTGTDRYGMADELGTSFQPMTVSQDKSFTFTIDRRNYAETMMVTEAGRALRRQIDEVVIPAVDKYRLSKLVGGAGKVSVAPLSDPYDAFLTGLSSLLDNRAPLSGIVAFASPAFYKAIRLDDGFIKASDTAQNMLITGQVGMIEGVPLVYAPSSYFPDSVEFIITNKSSAVAPIKLSDYKTHDNPPGLNGWLVEGRVLFDAFVLGNKAGGVYVHKSA